MRFTVTIVDVFVAFTAMIGPPKVVLTFAQVSRDATKRDRYRLATRSCIAACVVGVFVALAGPLLVKIFKVSDVGLLIAGGLVLLIYAIHEVLGKAHAAIPPEKLDLRALSLVYIANPVAIVGVLTASIAHPGWNWKITVALAYVAVAIADLGAMLLVAPGVHRAPEAALDISARVLGLLLGALGVETVLNGLDTLGVL